jgi:hypothetical protein
MIGDINDEYFSSGERPLLKLWNPDFEKELLSVSFVLY